MRALLQCLWSPNETEKKRADDVVIISGGWKLKHQLCDLAKSVAKEITFVSDWWACSQVGTGLRLWTLSLPPLPPSPRSPNNNWTSDTTMLLRCLIVRSCCYVREQRLDEDEHFRLTSLLIWDPSPPWTYLSGLKPRFDVKCTYHPTTCRAMPNFYCPSPNWFWRWMVWLWCELYVEWCWMENDIAIYLHFVRFTSRRHLKKFLFTATGKFFSFRIIM